ncbi:hypothetical protein EJB05_42358, partial [Eragrostis curvula]
MASAAVDAGVYEEMLRVVEACSARIRWRLRPPSKRRLLNDILFLCTGLRPVVLMDYGGTMPQLQENLCSLLHHARQESSILKPLKVMVIKDMLYLIHVEGLSEHASPNSRSQHQIAFVDLEKSCCKLLSKTKENDNLMEFESVQDLFSAKFPVEASVNLPIVRPGITKQKSEFPVTNVECTDIHIAEGTLLVDLSDYLGATQIALPSLNGWLLGYPVTYLFCNESAEAATQNLSKHSLHIYRVYVRRSCQSSAKQSEEELMCFSVPCEWEQPMGGSNAASGSQAAAVVGGEKQHTQYPYVTGTSVIALKYKDGVIMASDTGASYGSTLRYKSVERIKAVGKHSLIGASGEFSDFQEILRYLDELTLSDHMWDDGNSLGPKEIHSYLTRVMYNRRNKFDPLWNSLVLGGVKKGPKGEEKYLGMVNMIGTHFEENHIATGFGNHLAIPILRNEWREDMTFEEAVKLVEKCLLVLLYRDRASINKFQIAKITTEGATIYPPYSLKTFWGFSHFENPSQGAVGSW